MLVHDMMHNHEPSFWSSEFSIQHKSSPKQHICFYSFLQCLHDFSGFSTQTIPHTAAFPSSLSLDCVRLLCETFNIGRLRENHLFFYATFPSHTTTCITVNDRFGRKASSLQLISFFPLSTNARPWASKRVLLRRKRGKQLFTHGWWQ